MKGITDRFNSIINQSDISTKTPKRAGIIPYTINEEGDVLVYCMIPSDSAYGGTMPQMAKGGTDGNGVEETAWKEGEEELGLVRSNIEKLKFLGLREYTTGSGSDIVAIYYGKVKDTKKWNQPHYESGWTGWVNLNTEFSKIRSIQAKFFKEVLEKVKGE